MAGGPGSEGKCPGSLPLGWVVGESTPDTSIVLFDENGRRVAATGLYVMAEGPEGCVLGIVEHVASGNTLLPEEVTDHREVEAATRYPLLLERSYRRGVVKWISLLDHLVVTGSPRSPTIPLDPGTKVYAAPPSTLRAIFQGGDGWIPIGSLLRTDVQVPFSIEVNKLFRHLAILAVTGGGKSNTVCVLATRIVGELGGTMVLFDMHGEYASSSDLKNLLSGKVKVLKPKINPANLSVHELAGLLKISENAYVQERIMRDAWRTAYEEFKKQKKPLGDLLKNFREKVEKWPVGRKVTQSEKNAVIAIINKFDDMMEVYKDVIDPHIQLNLADIIELGKLTIFDLSELDEIGADAVVSHYMRRILEERKRHKTTGGSSGYPVPIIIVVEEAHVLIPRDESTLTKYWASRIAREGRKFGVGLVIVSQRPKKLDADVLSQANNKIVLRIVEPTDQRYVREASEQLSEDLTRVLPSLNPGEAIVVGSMTRIPALVKIDKCPARTGGADVDAISEWRRYAQGESEAEKQLVRDLVDAYNP